MRSNIGGRSPHCVRVHRSSLLSRTPPYNTEMTSEVTGEKFFWADEVTAFGRPSGGSRRSSRSTASLRLRFAKLRAGAPFQPSKAQRRFNGQGISPVQGSKLALSLANGFNVQGEKLCHSCSRRCSRSDAWVCDPEAQLFLVYTHEKPFDRIARQQFQQARPLSRRQFL